MRRMLGLGQARFSNIIDAQVAVTNSKARPGCSPLSQVRGREVTIQRLLIDPHLFHVNEARDEHVLGVAVFKTAFF